MIAPVDIEQRRADGRERDADDRGKGQPRVERHEAEGVGLAGKARREREGEQTGADFHHPGQGEQREGKDVTTSPAVSPPPPVEGAESRHESRVQPALADHPAHEVRQPERRQKRIRHRPRAKRLREQHIADESEDPRRARAEADQKGRADDRHAGGA